MDIGDSSLSDSSSYTNLELLERYREYLWLERGLSDSTINSYISDLRLFANWLGDRDTGLQAVSTEHVLNYLASRVVSGRSASTLARLLSSLKRFYILLARDGLKSHDPTALIDAPKLVRSPPAGLTEAEVDLLLRAPNIETAEGLRDRAMLELTYASGLRVSELITLQITQFDVHKSMLSVSGPGSHKRCLPIGAVAMDYLERYMQCGRDELLKHHVTCALLFVTRRGSGLTRQAFWYRVKKYALQVGIRKPLSPHSLRHAFAAHLVNHDADLRVVQHLLGHSSISTTQIYAHVAAERVKSLHEEHHPRA